MILSRFKQSRRKNQSRLKTRGKWVPIDNPWPFFLLPFWKNFYLGKKKAFKMRRDQSDLAGAPAAGTAYHPQSLFFGAVLPLFSPIAAAPPARHFTKVHRTRLPHRPVSSLSLSLSAWDWTGQARPCARYVILGLATASVRPSADQATEPGALPRGRSLQPFWPPSRR